MSDEINENSDSNSNMNVIIAETNSIDPIDPIVEIVEIVEKGKTNQQLIMEINRDKTLSGEEKSKKIREIMLGKFTNAEEIKVPDCSHYKKHCSKFKFECCGKVYDCCRCHNQAGICTNQIEISNIICLKCNTNQIPSNCCINCNTQFSRSYCKICNIWSEKNIYHCVKCGLCRVGSLDNYFHCDNCQCCFKKSENVPHVCKTILSATTQCLLCLETAVTTSQYHLIVLGCDHPVHSECLNMALKNGNYKCPMCRKSMINMQHYWTLQQQEILLHPLSEELQKTVNILCYDCQNRTPNANWHFFGTQCGSCGSFNTSTQ